MTSQDQFEAWASEHLPTLYLTKTDQGTYESIATGNFFAVWSARDGEIERLRAIFARPHNLKAKAADDYETLKKQFNALKTYAACQEKMRDHYRDAAEKLSKLDRSQSADEINAERSVNEQLTNDLLRAENERDKLKATVADYEMGLEAAKEEIARLKGENEGLFAIANLRELLPDLDEALEDLEVHGQHGDQGYRKLKDWYRKVALACKAIDAAMSKGEQP